MADRYLQKTSESEAMDTSERIWADRLAEVGTQRGVTQYAVSTDFIDEDGDTEAQKQVAESTLVFDVNAWERYRKYLTAAEETTTTEQRPKDVQSIDDGGGRGGGGRGGGGGGGLRQRPKDVMKTNDGDDSKKIRMR